MSFLKGFFSNVYSICGIVIVALYSLFRIEMSKKQEAQAKLDTADSSKKDAVLATQEQDVQKQINAIKDTPPPTNQSLDDLAKDLNT